MRIISATWRLLICFKPRNFMPATPGAQVLHDRVREGVTGAVKTET